MASTDVEWAASLNFESARSDHRRLVPVGRRPFQTFPCFRQRYRVVGWIPSWADTQLRF